MFAFFLALLLLLAARLRAISAALHFLWMRSAHFFLLLMLSAHLPLLLLPAHLLLLIHRMLSASSGCVTGLHLRLVSAHVSPVALIFGLQLVSVRSGASITCSRALPIMFSHITAVVFSFSRSGFRTFSLQITFSYVPRFVSGIPCSGCCSVALSFR